MTLWARATALTSARGSGADQATALRARRYRSRGRVVPCAQQQLAAEVDIARHGREHVDQRPAARDPRPHAGAATGRSNRQRQHHGGGAVGSADGIGDSHCGELDRRAGAVDATVSERAQLFDGCAERIRDDITDPADHIGSQLDHALCHRRRWRLADRRLARPAPCAWLACRCTARAPGSPRPLGWHRTGSSPVEPFGFRRRWRGGCERRQRCRP